MKYLFNKISRRGGMTLIEVTIYCALLSFLLSGFIANAYDTYFINVRINNEIQNAYEN